MATHAIAPGVYRNLLRSAEGLRARHAGHLIAPLLPTLRDAATSLQDLAKRSAVPAGQAVGSTPEQFAAFVRAEHAKWGELIKLEKTGAMHNTVIVFTADRGEMLGERGMWFKFNP